VVGPRVSELVMKGRGVKGLCILLLSLLPSCEQNSETEDVSTAALSSAAPTTSGHMMQHGSDTGGMMEELRSGCPMAIEGTKVEATDTDSGIALSFSSDKANISELRRRVRHLGHMYKMHRFQGRMMWHRMLGGAGDAKRMHRSVEGHMPGVSARVEETPEGARIILDAKDKDELDAVRNHGRWHQERMQSGECWMMGPPAASGKGE